MGAARRQEWSENHGAAGLRSKFAVYALRERGHGLQPAKDMLDPGEFVFVLRPECDRDAWLALHGYADTVAERAPQLAEDIRAKLRTIELHQERLTD